MDSLYDFNEDIKKSEKDDYSLTDDAYTDLSELDPAGEESFDISALLAKTDSESHQLFADVINTPPVDVETNIQITNNFTALRSDLQQEESPADVESPEFVELELTPEQVVFLSPEITGAQTLLEETQVDSCLSDENVVYALEESSPQSSVLLSEEQGSEDTTVSVVEAPLKPGTAAGRGSRKATPPSKAKVQSRRKNSVEKNSDEYYERRARNNIAVRKSRDKAKKKQEETESRVHELTTENERLNKKCDLLTKELNVLKGLFINIGAALPSEIHKYIPK